MKTNVSVSDGQRRFSALIRATEKGRIVTINRRNRPVACVISSRRLEAIWETLEILSNPDAREAIADHKAGKVAFRRLQELPD
jgi:prevent-host-death family protein